MTSHSQYLLWLFCIYSSQKVKGQSSDPSNVFDVALVDDFLHRSANAFRIRDLIFFVQIPRG